MQKIELDTKYSIVVHDDGRLEALRYNEPLVDLTGNEFILAIVGRIDFLQNNLEGAQHWCCELEGAVADAGFDIEESNNLESHPFPLKLVVKDGSATTVCKHIRVNSEGTFSGSIACHVCGSMWFGSNGSIVAKGAAQEAAAWQRKYLGATRGGRPVDWHNITREEFEATKAGKWADRYEVRALYAAHAAAAPMFDYQDVLGSAAAAEAIRDAGELLRTTAAPWIDLEQFRESVECLYSKRLGEYEDGQHSDADMQAYEVERRRLLALIDASPKGGSTYTELKIWGTQMPGRMPKLFGSRGTAELNWYPGEGYDLVCMQVIERVQPPARR